jgi:Ca2+-binding EF-hand superfamily protein
MADHEIKQRIPCGDYTQTRPVTIYTEALERKNHYMSAGTGPNPFAVTRGFTQPLDKTKAVVSYEGNINFDKEATTVGTMRNGGRDLHSKNPYNEKHVQMSNFAQIKAELIAACSKMANGMRALRLMFKKFDKDGNGSLDPKEFKEAIASFGIHLVELEVAQCLKYFDKNGDGRLSFTEFLGAVHGDLSAARKEAVHQCFFKVDPHMSGSTTLRALENQYIPIDNQDKQDFLDAWGTSDKNTVITLEDFECYYQDVSAHEPSDGIFMANLRVAWRM